MKTRSLIVALGMILLMPGAPALSADIKTYPDRPVRMIVPNAPGSSVDTLTRIVGNKLSEVLGQQVVIDNRAGAGGVIGMELGKAATPDGYTMIAATTAASTIAVQLLKKPTYDPVKDYDYVVHDCQATLDLGGQRRATYPHGPGRNRAREGAAG
jgi:Uncharacterized protein conserved in bacteria